MNDDKKNDSWGFPELETLDQSVNEKIDVQKKAEERANKILSRLLENKTTRVILIGGVLISVLYLVADNMMGDNRKMLRSVKAEQASTVKFSSANYNNITMDKLAARLEVLSNELNKVNKTIEDQRKKLQEKDSSPNDEVQKLKEQIVEIAKKSEEDKKKLVDVIQSSQKDNKKLIKALTEAQKKTQETIRKKLQEVKSASPSKNKNNSVVEDEPTVENAELGYFSLKRERPKKEQPIKGNSKKGNNVSEEPTKYEVKIRSIDSNGEKVLPSKEELAEMEAAKLKVQQTAAGLMKAANAKKANKKKDYPEVFLPAGSILSGTLLSGADLPTGGGAAKRDPFPILMRIKKEAILPNNFSLDIKECFLIGSGYSDLSSERGYLRAEILSCVSEDGKAFETTLDAFATGSDGKSGVRGRLVTRNGSLIARSLLAGVFGGFAQAITPQQIPSVQTVTDGESGNSNFVMPDTGAVLQSGAFKGLSSATGKIADYYIEMAEKIFPIVEINAGRKVDFIVKRGVSLKFKQ